MKRTLILLAILVMAGSAEAKIRVGLKGGMNFANLSTNVSPEGGSTAPDSHIRTGWHAGAMMNIGLPVGLTIQPELLYSSKGAKGTSVGYIEIPVDLQWGIKLPLLRPYLTLTPYASYAVNNNISGADINKWDGGVGAGVGVDIWKFQVSVKYFFGFSNVAKHSGDSSTQNRNLMFSLGIFL